MQERFVELPRDDLVLRRHHLARIPIDHKLPARNDRSPCLKYFSRYGWLKNTRFTIPVSSPTATVRIFCPRRAFRRDIASTVATKVAGAPIGILPRERGFAGRSSPREMGYEVPDRPDAEALEKDLPCGPDPLDELAAFLKQPLCGSASP